MNAPHGDPEGLVQLMVCRNELQAQEIRLVLEEAGMPAFVFNKGGLGLNMVDGDSRVGAVQVQVPSGRAEEARAILHSIEEASAGIDWDEVDVGEPPPEVANILESRGMTHAIGHIVSTLGPILGILILLGVVVGIVIILAT
jgi:hypothetical protein